MNFILEAVRQNPGGAAIAFAIAHLAASMTGFPGGCTVLNVAAGAMFGFERACALIYPVTMASAFMMYSMGGIFRGGPWAQRLQERLTRFFDRVRGADFAVLVGLRLSPVVPFGVMNFACGVLNVPRIKFFLSTAIGIFFDVTVLAGIGAFVGSR